jgi:hypothetical protein
MRANDEASATTNRIILINALNAGTKVLVDDKYYLQSDSLTYGTLVTKDIYIKGISFDAEFCFTDTADTHFIEVQSNNLSIMGVKFSRVNTTNYTWVFTAKDGLAMDKVNFDYCYFTGNLRLFTWSLSSYIDPSVTWYGIKSFHFNYNHVKNIKTRYKGFIYLDNTPVTYSELLSNQINNFWSVIYDAALGDGNPYTAEISERMEYLSVRHNVVKNDLDWCKTCEIQTYHCFIYFEGNKCEYVNNHVEGLHVFDKIHSLTIGSVIAGHSITLNGITFTCVDSGAVSPQFNKGASSSITATNLAQAINDMSLGFTATIDGSSVMFSNNDDVIIPSDVSSTILPVSIGLYDGYFSCWDLLYEGNTWKNNINFTPMKNYNDLMKAKSHAKSTYVGTRRIFLNNTFIVEESYVTDINTVNNLSRTVDELWVTLSQYQHEFDQVVVDNNVIDVYELRMPYNQEIHKYEFNNNSIHAYKMKDAPNCILPMYILTTADTLTRYVARNNTIIIDVANIKASGYGQNYLIFPYVSTTGDEKDSKVIFENNYIEWPNLAGLVGNNTSSRICVLNEVRMTGNKIITTSPGTSGGKILTTTNYCHIKKFIFDNEVDIPTSGYNFKPTPTGGHQSLDYNLKLKMYPTHATNQFVGIASKTASGDTVELLNSTVVYNRVSVKCLYSTGEENFTFDFTHYYDAEVSTTVNVVDFTKGDDTPITGQALDGTGTNDGALVKCSTPPHVLIPTFKNTGNNIGFYLHNDITTTEYCTYEVTIRQSKVG